MTTPYDGRVFARSFISRVAKLLCCAVVAVVLVAPATALAAAPTKGDRPTATQAAPNGSSPTVSTGDLGAVPVREVVLGGRKHASAFGVASAETTGPVWFLDNFESGTLDTSWSVLDANTWGVSGYIMGSSGNYSAWCLGDYPDDLYPDDFRAHMVRGPYDLSTSSGQTAIKAALWLDSEPDFDFAKILVSTNGVNYYGSGYSGEYPYWRNAKLDLTNVYTLGDVSKSPNLYVMLGFSSDESGSGGLGVFFDDVTLKDLGPDLISASVIASPSARAGSSLSISDDVVNQGTNAASAFNVSYYLSSDQTVTASDVRLGSRSISTLAGGATDHGARTFTIPAGVVGTYYIGAIADSDKGVAEANEGNNIASGNLVQIAPGVYPTSLSCSGAATVRRNRAYKLSGSIKPAGAGGRVKIVWKRYSSGSYRTVKTTYAALSGGRFYSSYKPTKTGKWRACASYPGQSTAVAIYGASAAAYKAFKVR